MATVTFNLAQITGSPLTGLEPRVYVLLPHNVAYQSSVVVTRPAPVTPDSFGNGSVSLIPQAYMRGTGGSLRVPNYRFKVEWLDSSGQPGVPEYPDFEFRVPPEGGALEDMIVTRPSAFETWIGTTPPPELGSYLWWFNPVTGNFFEWSD